MGMIEGLAAIVTVLTGGATLFVGAGRWIRAPNQFRELQKALQDIRKSPNLTLKQQADYLEKRKAAGRDDEEHALHVMEWMNYGSLLLPQVQRKILRRTALMTVLIVIAAAGVYDDSPGALWGVENLETADLFLFAFSVLFPAMLRLSDYWLSHEEALFLENMFALEEWFYEREVMPGVRHFNVEAKNFFGRQKQASRSAIDALRSRIRFLLRGSPPEELEAESQAGEPIHE